MKIQPLDGVTIINPLRVTMVTPIVETPSNVGFYIHFSEKHYSFASYSTRKEAEEDFQALFLILERQ